MNTHDLDDAQLETLAFIASFAAREGYPPTVREIADVRDVHPNSVAGTLTILDARGLIDLGERDEETKRRPSRSIRITDEGRAVLASTSTTTGEAA